MGRDDRRTVSVKPNVSFAGGDAHLGGDDWDAVIVAWLEKEVLRPAGLRLGDDPLLAANVRLVAEAAKVRLSTADKVYTVSCLPTPLLRVCL